MILQFIPLQDAAAQGGGFSGIIMIVLLLLVFWLFMIRPQQKRQKEIKNSVKAFQKATRLLPPAVFSVELPKLTKRLSWWKSLPL